MKNLNSTQHVVLTNKFALDGILRESQTMCINNAQWTKYNELNINYGLWTCPVLANELTTAVYEMLLKNIIINNHMWLVNFVLIRIMSMHHTAYNFNVK